MHLTNEHVCTEGDKESVYPHFFFCEVPIIERMGFGADISVRRVVKDESKCNMYGMFTNPNVTCMGCSIPEGVQSAE